ncbi:hypothetical protein DFJ74DRAFT_643812 [Hyaloraphidium curvatum]|nr:hypothetical protein DFJ74DRAFT_643812 [Hyaloraphidium curvatum]
MLAVRLHPSSGSLFFYSDTHIYSNGAVYEFTVPSFSATAPYPAANVTNEFGIAALYGARRLDEALRPFGAGGCNVNGLHYDDVLGGLFWVYSEPYSTGNKGAPTLGFTPLSVSPSGPASGLGTPQGPWKVHPNIHWVRGGIASVPHGYAARMDPALRLAVGFGGTYSIVAGASWGPAMTLVNPANPGSSPRTVLGFDEAAGSRCPRPGDYWIADPGWLGTDPVNGTGTWTGSDVIGWETGAGSAVWTDAGALRGVLFWTSQGTGRIAYENGGIQQAGRTNRLYIFDPEDLVAAHGGASIRVRPRWYGDFPMPPGFAEGQFAGIARDPSDPAAFYAVQTGAAREGLEWHPVLHRFRIE